MSRKAAASPARPISFEHALESARGPGAKLLGELAGVAPDAPVPEWHIDELVDSLENDAGGDDWDTVRARVFGKRKPSR